jgi:hypothetical protein
VRLATVFVSQLMRTMLLAGSAVATRLPTPALNRNEASSQQWPASGHLLNAAFEHATNISGMTRDAHGELERLGKLKSSLAYQKMLAKHHVRRKNIIAKTRVDRK